MAEVQLTLSKKNEMWGGRFSGEPAEIMKRINASISFDQRLYAEDIQASKAHSEMLAKQSIITADDNLAIQRGLDQILREIETGSLSFRDELEDIHMNIEARLREVIGDAAGRLHTARSRNDQAVTGVRLWLRAVIDELNDAVQDLQSALIDRAEEHAGTVMPGFTHLQVAQPVTFGHHLLAYVEMLGRDRGRLRDGRVRLNQSPLGAAALAGTSFAVDRELTSKRLGFDAPTENSMDSVSARDHIAEFLFAASMLSVHLSRLAEELVLWSSDGFRFITLSDEFTTGSSIMPQKRNPDAAELVRAKPGRIIGSLNALLIMLKGLPLAFMKDMQEDKEPLFDAVDNIRLAVAATTGMIRDLTARPDKMRAFLQRGFPTATDLADWLVRELNVPFREAHHITGRIVALAEEKGRQLAEVDLSDMQGVDGRIHDGVFQVLGIDHSVQSRQSYGGTAPEQVRKAIERAKRRYLA